MFSFEESKISDQKTSKKDLSSFEKENQTETTAFLFSGITYNFPLKENMDPLILQITANKNDLENLFSKRTQKEKNKNLSKISNYHSITALEFFLKHHDVKHPSMDDEKCSICLTEFFENLKRLNIIDVYEDLHSNNKEEIIRLEHCDGHYFHLQCIIDYINSSNAKSHIKCPNCTRIYGVMTGDQPQGTMRVTVNKNLHCSGYKSCGTIVIEYNFPNGKLSNGTNYSGTSRVGYLPDNDEGREVLRLLKISFDRKLTFTVGTSVTTGRTNTVVWNGVHHKTNLSGGSSCFGFPDPTYFDRVKLELASRGVV